MLKFIRGKGNQPSVERQKLQKELFAYTKTVQHGFPHKPTAVAYDPKHKLMAIGTQTGSVKVFGRPGVEFYGQHTNANGTTTDCSVQLLEWIPGSGRVLSLTASNQLVLWEPAGSLLVPIKSLPFDGKLKKVSSLCCSQLRDIVWIGTEGGNVYQFDLKTFSIKEPVIYHDIVLEQVPASYKLSPGAIECITQLPNNFDQLLLTYNRGLCVLWDLELNKAIKSYVSPGHGQSVGICFHPDGENFVWYHADGSYAKWNIEDNTPPKDESYVPYGPDPCKSINRLSVGLRSTAELTIFAGGMPRSAYGEHNCISVHSSTGNKVALDFTSKVIDFFVTYNDYQETQAEVLIVLLEEELCAFDLTKSNIPPVQIPYLHSIHASAVTCNHLVSQVSGDIYEKIVQAGQGQLSHFSEIDWPVNGGSIPDKEHDPCTQEYEILLTGHEDGSVKFWDCTGVVLSPLLQFKTATLFGGEHDDLDAPHESTEQSDDSEPPFRKAGIFDPYSDDPRLAVKKIAFCAKSGQLIVAGTAGHIVIAGLEHKFGEGPMKATTMNLVSDRDGFVWKGHDQLNVKPNLLDEEIPPIENGVQVVSVLQVLPPAAITCLALQSNWNLVAAGTAHGLVLFDYVNHHPVLYRCNLNPNDSGEALTRRKSFKKTLRESFRRLRKGRSTRNNPTNQTTAQTIETRPIERQVEARPVDDGMGSMVRCLTFAQTYITNMHSTIPTLWSGTNSSCVSVFVLSIPARTNQGDQKQMITGQLAKEIQMKHRAPIVGISIFDHAGIPLELAGPGTSPHRVLIASEEQFKVFSLPQLKPVTKYKLTAHEGARVRRLHFGVFSCPSHRVIGNEQSPVASEGSGDHSHEMQPKHTEIGLLCLTNLGDCLILSIPELKRQLNAAAIKREDISGITSLCFTNFGEAVYMMSSSEIQRISLSATKMVAIDGAVDLEVWETEEAINIDSQMDTSGGDDAPKKSDLDIITEEIRRPLTTGIDSGISLGTNDGGAGSNNQSETHLSNGIDSSPAKANETITSSIGDITLDSVRDHLNSTTTTLCSTTTEEIVGRLSVLSTQTNNATTTVKMNDITEKNLANLKDLSKLGETLESNSSQVVIKSVITTVSTENGTNGEAETVTTKSTTRKESQF